MIITLIVNMIIDAVYAARRWRHGHRAAAETIFTAAMGAIGPVGWTVLGARGIARRSRRSDVHAVPQGAYWTVTFANGYERRVRADDAWSAVEVARHIVDQMWWANGVPAAAGVVRAA